MDPAFNATVRAKYSYSLAFIPWDREIEKEDRGATEGALIAMLRTKTHINTMSGQQVQTVYQWEELRCIKDRGVRRMILKWTTAAEVEGKSARGRKESFDQAPDLKPSTPLRKAWEMTRRGKRTKRRCFWCILIRRRTEHNAHTGGEGRRQEDRHR